MPLSHFRTLGRPAPDLIVLAVLLLGLALSAGPRTLHAQQPRDLVETLDGPRTEILVLGTRHLSGLNGFDPGHLEPLLERLAAWAPRHILIERLPARQIEAMSRSPEGYPGILDFFMGSLVDVGWEVREALGLDLPGIEAELDDLLGPSMTTEERERAVALLVASWDFDSAVIHWRRLPESRRVPGGPLTPEVVELLDARDAMVNETVAIAAELAGRLDLPRLLPFDDQTDKRDFRSEPWVESMSESGALEAVMESDAIAQLRSATSGVPASGAEVLDEYRFLNSSAYGTLDIRAQWLTFAGVPSEGLGRFRVAMWETRNILMAAHIRRQLARHPGERALVVVGAAHRPWLEAVLRESIDVRIVDFAEIGY